MLKSVTDFYADKIAQPKAQSMRQRVYQGLVSCVKQAPSTESDDTVPMNEKRESALKIYTTNCAQCRSTVINCDVCFNQLLKSLGFDDAGSRIVVNSRYSVLLELMTDDLNIAGAVLEFMACDSFYFLKGSVEDAKSQCSKLLNGGRQVFLRNCHDGSNFNSSSRRSENPLVLIRLGKVSS